MRGFRLSLIDACFLLVVGAGTWLMWPSIGEPVLLAPIALGHFFLFCNVFRVRRSYELIWAALFLANVAAWSIFGSLSWWAVLASQSPVTLAVIVAEIRSPRYHGIFSRSASPPEAR